MKQTFYTGEIPFKIDIEDGKIAEKHKKHLRPGEIKRVLRNPNQVVFFRRYSDL